MTKKTLYAVMKLAIRQMGALKEFYKQFAKSANSKRSLFPQMP